MTTKPQTVAEVQAALAEADRIMARSNAEIHAEALAEFGSEEAISAAAEDIRAKLLAAAARVPAQVPTPDPAVLIDYIDRLTRFFIDRPEWIALAEEARNYIGRTIAMAEKEEQ